MPILSAFPGFCPLFKFNRSRRLRRTIITNPVHILHLSQYPVRYPLQHLPVHFLHTGGHCINRINRTDNHHILKASRMVLHPNRFKIRNYGKILPYLFIQSGFFEFLPQNRIRFPYSFQPVTGDRAKTADTEAGAGERLTVYHPAGSPSSIPQALTSSLNSCFRGSTSSNCRSSGSPPTL